MCLIQPRGTSASDETFEPRAEQTPIPARSLLGRTAADVAWDRHATSVDIISWFHEGFRELSNLGGDGMIRNRFQNITATSNLRLA